MNPNKKNIRYYGEETYFEITSYKDQVSGTVVQSRIPLDWNAQIVVPIKNEATEGKAVFTDQNGTKYRLATDTDYPQVNGTDQVYFKSASGLSGFLNEGYETSGKGSGDGGVSDNFPESDAHIFVGQRHDPIVSGKNDSPRDRNLKKAPSKGAEPSPYNLASTSGVMGTFDETANCYVINAPVWYCFPMVYGNALKNNANNTDAFKMSNSNQEQQKLQKFANHNNTVIKNPWIDAVLEGSKGAGNFTAGIVWQDVQNLISDVSIMTDNNSSRYIKFYVSPANIAQGNAVISVRQNTSDVMAWSWHIWVTDYDLSTSLVSSNGTGYNFMRMPLGYVEDEVYEYNERTLYVLFSQDEAMSDPILVPVNQTAGTVARSGNAPYYQWGRKDPYVPALSSQEQNKQTFPANVHKAEVAHSSLGVAICNPTKAYVCNSASCSQAANVRGAWWDIDASMKTRYNENIDIDTDDPNYPPGPGKKQLRFMNLWDVEIYPVNGSWFGSTRTVKSIYDPCPPGFCVPPVNAFMYFNGKRASRVDTPFEGVYMSISNDEIFFPALGYREADLGSGYPPTSIRTYGRYWTASVPNANGTQACYVQISSNGFSQNLSNPTGMDVILNISNGCSILPVACQ